MPLQVQIGNQFGNDGTVVNQRGDNYGSTMVQEFNGKYAEVIRRGQMFIASSAAAGVAILITSTNGGGQPTLWNPAGSGKICYPVRMSVNWLSGTTTAGAILFNYTANTGSQAATASPILTFTNAAPIPALVGGSAVSSMRWAPATATPTFTTAPAFWGSTGISMKAAAEDYVIYMDYDGSIALSPGTALSLGYSVASSTALLQFSIWFVELPLPTGM
jgi:hypothetical protein